MQSQHISDYNQNRHPVHHHPVHSAAHISEQHQQLRPEQRAAAASSTSSPAQSPEQQRAAAASRLAGMGLAGSISTGWEQRDVR
jgi:hypothetical protein